MDDLESIFSNLKLNFDNPSDTEDVVKYLKEIDHALKTNETISKWIDELHKEHGSVVDDGLDKLIEMSHNDGDFFNPPEHDAGALRYSVVEIIAKRCLRIEIKIRRDGFQAEDAISLVKFINQHKVYYADKENMVGFRYVANCLAIKGQLQEIQKKMAKESKQVSASGLKELLKTINEYQQFGIPHQVGVLAIKQYFAGNLLNVCYDYQLKTIRNVSVSGIIINIA